MESDEVREVGNQARIYGLKYMVERIALPEEEFEYKVSFGRGLTFQNGRAALLFIDAMIKEHNLKEHPSPYRVAFGWEIF